MFTRALPLMLALLLSPCLTSGALAATYYVDFAGGDNTADGRSPRTAWKHAPGDPNATGGPAAVQLAPGDTVAFRGGVAYHGSIRVAASGEPGKPITFAGGTGGSFGTGRAILDGGRVIENWQRCQSPQQAGGNPRWGEIFYADVDVDITPNVTHGRFIAHRQVPRDVQAPWQRIILIDGDRRLLPIAQHPKPSDPFYPDLPGDFLETEHRLDVRTDEGVSVITDEANLTAEDPDDYDGTFIGVHGGNNHVYFGVVQAYDPETHRLFVPEFKPSTYETTRYALYNSVRLISRPGEWAIEALDKGKARIYLLPGRLEDGRPDNIGFPEFQTGISIDKGASHIEVESFLIQRYSGGAGGVSVSRGNDRSHHIRIADCEIRFLSGHAGIGPNYCDDIVIENCYIHHCPGWTTAVFLNRVNRYVVRDCYLRKNSGSGIRHYECKQGILADNVVLEHFGMHASGINLYEGCEDLLLEGNYVDKVITINRNAEAIIFRNNVINGRGRSSVCLAMWRSGRTGGRDITDVRFLNNTFVNTNPRIGWASGIFGQQHAGTSTPEGLVVRNNILDRVHGEVRGVFEDNIYLRETEERYMGSGCQVVEDPQSLFRDWAEGDLRRRDGGPAMDAGATVPPPPARPAGF
ncbi:MAG: right-handed parallel beta-helix repeat-containing protein [Planctomycetota bacterium]